MQILKYYHGWMNVVDKREKEKRRTFLFCQEFSKKLWMRVCRFFSRWHDGTENSYGNFGEYCTWMKLPQQPTPPYILPISLFGRFRWSVILVKIMTYILSVCGSLAIRHIFVFVQWSSDSKVKLLVLDLERPWTALLWPEKTPKVLKIKCFWKFADQIFCRCLPSSFSDYSLLPENPKLDGDKMLTLCNASLSAHRYTQNETNQSYILELSGILEVVKSRGGGEEEGEGEGTWMTGREGKKSKIWNEEGSEFLLRHIESTNVEQELWNFMWRKRTPLPRFFFFFFVTRQCIHASDWKLFVPSKRWK